jgi:uncharacterized repeat protein (TIGR01451 family)
MGNHKVINSRNRKHSLAIKAGLSFWLSAATLLLYITPVAALPDKYASLPVVFETNQGQFSANTKYMARGSGYNLYLANSSVTMAFYRAVDPSQKMAIQDPAVQRLKMNFVGTNPAPHMSGISELAGKSNYFLGDDRASWIHGVKQYKNVEYRNIYPGIDLVFYGNQNRLEYDYVIKPGANYKSIRVNFGSGERLHVDKDGNLILHAAGGDLTLQAPYAYQEIDGNRRRIDARYVLHGNGDIGFQVASYDNSHELIIDPVLSYSTYLGGALADAGTDIAVDTAGNAYITGYTLSTDFNTVSALNPASAGAYDIFVAKISPDGASLIYSTYLGGSGNDRGYGVAVDINGDVVVAGATESSDFPVASAIQSGYGGLGDGFVSKLNAAGDTLLYSTYVGGAGSDEIRDITITTTGEVYLAGSTASADFPVVAGFQMTKASAIDAFVAKINSAGTAFVFSSYLGGSNGAGDDYGYAIAVDGRDDVYVAGKTSAMDFPTVSAYQGVYGGGTSDAFVVKIHPLGSNLMYATYLGGSGSDVANGIAVDSDENIYVAGSTQSADFPIVSGSYDSTCGTDGNCNSGKSDAFAAKLTADGASLSYSTYLGGSDHDFGSDIALGGSGNVYIGGYTNSADFPVVFPLQATHGGVSDVFVTRLSTTGAALGFSTFLGGSNGDTAQALTVDGIGNVYVTGNTTSADFPTSSALQAGFAGITDTFVAKIGAVADLWVTMSDMIDPADAGSAFSYTIIVTNNGPDVATNTVLTDVLPTGLTILSSASTQGSCTGTTMVTCSLGSLASSTNVIITMNVIATQTITNSVSVTSDISDTDTSNNVDSEQTVINPSTQTSAISSSGGGGGDIYGLLLILLLYITLTIIAGIRRGPAVKRSG